MRGLGRAIGRGLDGARKSPLVQLVAIGTVGLSLVLVGAVALAGANLRRLSAGWGADVQLIVYLEDGISGMRSQQIAGALARLPGVTAVRAVDPHEAWERLRRGLGARADLLDGVEEGFLPASI